MTRTERENDRADLDALNDGYITRHGEDLSPAAANERRSVLLYLLGMRRVVSLDESTLVEEIIDSIAHGEHTKVQDGD